VKNRQLLLIIVISLTSISYLFSACRKINEATDLGGDLIPPVDNITTFDTTINVEAYNELYSLLNDSIFLGRSDEQFLGRINNDPLFGGTDARMFLELKPTFYKYHFGRKDSLTIDSIVVMLDYVETYGDSTESQTVNVYEIDQGGETFSADSSYLIRKEYFTYSNLLGSRTFTPSVLNDSVKTRGDSTINQFRIRLDNSFGTRLLAYDTISPNGAYVSDSVFRTKFKGFAFRSMNSGNAIMGFNLGGVNTKLAVYYHYPKPNLGVDSSAISFFRFTTLSAGATYIERDHSFGEIAAVQGGTLPDDHVYIQNTPGSYARIKIPGLASVSNRLIHRAELIMEQEYHETDTVFTVPELLHLDAFDPTIALPKKQYRTIPYDFQFDQQGNPNFFSFGAYPANKLDVTVGKNVKIWKFNISRYVQHVLTQTSPSYELRLSSPYAVVNQYSATPTSSSDQSVLILGNNTVAKGRVRLAGGTGTSVSHPKRMRLRLIYSKI
jgi:hypothetical protein